MSKKKSRRIVIDACIARSAGGDRAKKGRSILCTSFLLKVLKICYIAIFTEELFEEWRKHRTDFARKWQKTMFSKNKAKILDNSEDQLLRNRIRLECERRKLPLEEVLKDTHLVEAAIKTDKTIASLDNKARNNFSKMSPGIGELRSIYWINPANPDENVIQWLESGSIPDANRLLCN
ncbi:MAG: hypothetical protein K8T10_19730 [Candidatus Eremiobacteraeota bacterium]|nr:hypothetical protein [Candidatus Eremiobacteraeota bacterium]